jgi:DNA-binding HxlR family transcriptional regulator
MSYGNSIFRMTRKKSYGQFCPVAKGAEVVAERWNLLILRELLCGSSRFNDLKKGVPLMSPSLLSQRLKDLEYAGVVEIRPAASGRGSEYFLTDSGQELRPLIEGLGHWAEKCLKPELEGRDLDPGLLMWDIARRVDATGMPDASRSTVQFNLTGVSSKYGRWWIVFENGETDLCMKDPGFDLDLNITVPMPVAADVWIGRRTISEAVRKGDLVLEGTRDQVRAFPAWFTLSIFAPG